MAGRAIWKAVVTLAQFAVPVKLYSAVHAQRLSFHLLHDNDKTRLQQRLVCPLDEQVVPAAQQIKGYEVAAGQYVVLEPDEFDALEPDAGRQIDISAVTPIQQIDPRYFSRTYYLGPDGHAKQYKLLAAALQQENSAAICQWVMRRKSYLGALRADAAGLLSIITLHRASELVAVAELALPDPVAVSAKELETARYLINTLSEEFQPANYHDQYQQQLRDLINQKASGETGALPAPVIEPQPTESAQLLQMLEASVQQAVRAKKAA